MLRTVSGEPAIAAPVEMVENAELQRHADFPLRARGETRKEAQSVIAADRSELAIWQAEPA